MSAADKQTPLGALVPANTDALTVRKAALEYLAAAAPGTNLSQTMWLKVEIADAESRLGANQGA